MASKIINHMRKVIGPCKTGNDGYVWFEDEDGDWLYTKEQRQQLIAKLKEHYEHWHSTYNEECHAHVFVYRGKKGEFLGLVQIDEEHRGKDDIAISLFTFPFLKTEEEMVKHLSKNALLVKL